jgi:hypothetical protein
MAYLPLFFAGAGSAAFFADAGADRPRPGERLGAVAAPRTCTLGWRHDLGGCMWGCRRCRFTYPFPRYAWEGVRRTCTLCTPGRIALVTAAVAGCRFVVGTCTLLGGVLVGHF